uniref:Uncharacterized protein n=1 Tax=Tanacetum cinerariifolium TaxID=118510 RepID=A0A6L2ND36_TANCI|nr:hypothetical protein [Tanacetum cinerariifolium]
MSSGLCLYSFRKKVSVIPIRCIQSSGSESESGIRDDKATKSRSIKKSDDDSGNTDEEDDSSDDTSQNGRSLKKHKTIVDYEHDEIAITLIESDYGFGLK